MSQAVAELGALKTCDMAVLSDANTEFISEILQHYSLQGCFQQVRITAPGQQVGGRIEHRHTTAA